MLRPHSSASARAASSSSDRPEWSYRQSPRPDVPEGERLWRINDQRAQKAGPHRAVMWVTKRRPEELEQVTLGSRSASRADSSQRNKMDVYKTGVVYQGEWQDNLKHGYGVQVWPNGNKYEGDWEYGKRSGHGVFWVKVKAKKKGKAKAKTKAKAKAASSRKQAKLRKQYAGNWKDDLKHGLGVFFAKDGTRYEGQFAFGLRQGKGTMFFTNGDVFVGDWVEGKRQGFGTLTYANGDVYEGHWLNDKKEGEGLYYFQETEKLLDGEWANDVARCGMYTDAREYFGEDQNNDGDGDRAIPPMSAEHDAALPEDPATRYREFLRRRALGRQKLELPELGLEDAEAVLAKRVSDIERERSGVRSLANQSLDELFPPEKIDELRRTFSLADNGSGSVRAVQLKTLLRDAGHRASDQLLAEVLLAMDKNVQATLNFAHFVQAAYIVANTPSSD